MAPEPSSWSINLASSNAWVAGSTAYHYDMTLNVNPATSINMNVHVYRPAGTGPFPVVVNIGDDSSKAWVTAPRAYILVTYSPEIDLDPDTEGYDVVGPAQAAYPQCDWGSLCVWAWGASRVVDYLETRTDVQIDHVIIRGHSRTGKAAILAGAFDERFALAVPNGSGTGGSSVYRIRNSGGETLSSITNSSHFRSWFQPLFYTFANKETKLPFDQHWLAALVAPRLILSTEAVDDLWSNPLGSQASIEAARHVYEFLGAPASNAGIHIRSGGHENLDEDWNAMLDFAGLKFFGIPSARNFNYKWNTGYSPAYTWTTPVRNDPVIYDPADLNTDQSIDIFDLQFLCDKWLQQGASTADFVNNCKVDFDDYSLFINSLSGQN